VVGRKWMFNGFEFSGWLDEAIAKSKRSLLRNEIVLLGNGHSQIEKIKKVSLRKVFSRTRSNNSSSRWDFTTLCFSGLHRVPLHT
jgi:hypothetical protein